MAVRLLRPWNGQAVNTIYARGYTPNWNGGETVLRSTSNADDFVENASDYAAYQRYVDGARLANDGLPDGLTLAGAAQQLSAAVSIPPGLRWQPSGVIFSASAGGYTYTGTSILALATTPVRTLWFDPTNKTGNAADANAGTLKAAPLLTVAGVLAKITTNGDTVRTFGQSADVTQLVTSAPAAINVSYSVVNETGFRVRVLRVASATAVTWAATAGQPGVYETTIAPASALTVVDLAIKDDLASLVQIPTNGTAADRDRFRAIVRNAPAAYNQPQIQTSIANVAANPGSRYHDGTKLYVQTVDSRNLVGDTSVWPLVGGVFFRGATANNLTQYFSGFDFIGGHTGFFINPTLGNAGSAYILDNCSIQHTTSGGTGNGVAVQGAAGVTLNRTLVYKPYADGANYHSNTSTGGESEPSPKVWENECVFAGSGTTGSAAGSDNASTAHESTDVASTNCVYINSDDRVIADINFARRLVIGCYIGAPTNLANTAELAANQNVDNFAMNFNDGVKYGPNTIGVAQYAKTSAQILNRNVGVVTQFADATATIAPYR